jgi:hypothetical protein
LHLCTIPRPKIDWCFLQMSHSDWRGRSLSFLATKSKKSKYVERDK